MEDSEKLTALKRAYADIILNTAKEAAARIMVSERKALRFQRELVSTKEEALRMLLRLKQMLDSKVREAETTSFSQKKKIEELEAQLQEAEDIVKDLREELREMQAVLEKVENKPLYSAVNQNIEDGIAAEEKLLMDHRLDPCGSIYSVPNLQFESVSTDNAKNSIVNGSNVGSKCCVSQDHINNCNIHNPDFASIVIKRKAPELYRNGCTQRICASERSLLNGNMSPLGNADDILDEPLIRGDDEGKEGERISVTSYAETHVISEVETPDELKVACADPDLVKLPVCEKRSRKQKMEAFNLRLCSDQVNETINPSDTTATLEHVGIQNGAVKEKVLVKVPVCRKKIRIKRRKHLRPRNHLRPRLCPEADKVKETNKKSYISCTTDSLYASDNSDPSKENSSKVCEDEAKKDLMSYSAKVPSETNVMTEQSRCPNDSEKETVLLKHCSSWNKCDDDKEQIGKSDSTVQESLSTGRLEVSSCVTNIEAANELSDKVECKISDLDEKVACQPVNDRLLKYTFQRKRKKDALSSPDVDCSREASSLKRKCGEKENEHVEPQKACTIVESSRDSRRLAQVARQLISLSEKKWWP